MDLNKNIDAVSMSISVDITIITFYTLISGDKNAQEKEKEK
jgi:hypothetical protein